MTYYCAHVYEGNPKCKKDAKRKVRAMQLQNHDDVYIAPTQAFGFLYSLISFEEWMRLCLSLMERCDIFLIISPPSQEVVISLMHARRIGMIVEYADGMERLYEGIDPCL